MVLSFTYTSDIDGYCVIDCYSVIYVLHILCEMSLKWHPNAHPDREVPAEQRMETARLIKARCRLLPEGVTGVLFTQHPQVLTPTIEFAL